MIQKKFRYRKKGKYTDGRIKIVIEMIDKGKVIGSVNLPKPERMWVVLKCPDISKEKKDAKNHKLTEKVIPIRDGLLERKKHIKIKEEVLK